MVRNAALIFALTLSVTPTGLQWQGLSRPQSERERIALKGITTMSVVVDAPDPDSEVCGIKEDDLKLRAAEKLRFSGIDVKETADPRFFIEVHTAKVGEQCVTSVRVSVGVFAYVQFPYQQKPEAVRQGVLLYEDSSMLTPGPRLTNGERVRSWLRPVVDDFVARVSQANPK